MPYSKKLTCNDFNAKVINTVEELLLYLFNEISAVAEQKCLPPWLADDEKLKKALAKTL